MSESHGVVTRQSRAKLPRGVVALGLVSLFMDMSSEMIHALLPVFFVGTLSVSTFALGLIEGIAEGIASITKVFSGALSDRFRARKPLVLLGYGLAALTKPLFPLATGPWLAIAARFTDRVGKGIRGAPRDALLADITPVEQRGEAYGLRQSMDTAGAFIGPLIATGLLSIALLDVRAVLWIATIPACCAVVVLAIFVREPGATRPRPERSTSRFELARFPPRFWWLVTLVVAFTLTRFSEAFLVLRAAGMALPAAYVPLTLVVMSATYMLTAYPAGWLADRISPHGLLAMGCLVMIGANACLGAAHALPLVWIGIALWGVHMGLTEGVLAALTAKHAPDQLRGTAFGIVNLARGVTTVLASALAGLLWSTYGPAATFTASAIFACITAGLALAQRTQGAASDA
jgi:MFS family permease